MADEPRQMSIKERIAQMKLDQVEHCSPAHKQVVNHTTGSRNSVSPASLPVMPPRPAHHVRAQSIAVPTTTGVSAIGNQPAILHPVVSSSTNGGSATKQAPMLPPRTVSQSSPGPTLPPRKPSLPSPALPPRRPSEASSQSTYGLSRRGSNESVSSVGTTRSSISGISQSDRYAVKAPAYDASALPPLPPKRTEEAKQAYYDSGVKTNGNGRRALKPTYSAPNVSAPQVGTTPPPARRPSFQPSQHLPAPLEERRQIEAPPPRARLIEPPKPKRSALEMGLGNRSRPQAAAVPPPIPTASRPDLAALQASKPKTGSVTSTAPLVTAGGGSGSCLHCRDFSGPDNHAARFPRQSLPSSDTGYLANQLTAPFPSHTDKARAIFTWLHHNIAYDTQAFFSGNIRPSTPGGTISSGLAVCEGYAGLFAALALKAGLEVCVIGGHSKGYGFSALKPGESLPPWKASHAWNAVKIDGGQWKLIDPCWGAGNVNGQSYEPMFKPERFTQNNEDFGLDHYPPDTAQQFRSDGRVVTYEEYYLRKPPLIYGFVTSEGVATPTIRPAESPIVLAQQGPTVRFSFQKVCPHWDPIKNGKGPYYLYVLAIENLQGSPKHHIPFETNGEVWWCDVPLKDLGRPGQVVDVTAMSNLGDGKDPRGLTAREYTETLRRGGRGGGQGVAKWELA